MDDVLTCTSGINYENFNSIHLYLRVHMLSEITDSTGKQLCSEILDGTAHPFPSTLQWPHQPNPTPEAWRIWTTTISLLYIKLSDSQSLLNPLGEWLPQTATKHCHWIWFACPTTLTLYQQHPDGWLQYEPFIHRPMTAIHPNTYPRSLQPQHQLPHRVPMMLRPLSYSSQYINGNKLNPKLLQ